MELRDSNYVLERRSRYYRRALLKVDSDSSEARIVSGELNGRILSRDEIKVSSGQVRRKLFKADS